MAYLSYCCFEEQENCESDKSISQTLNKQVVHSGPFVTKARSKYVKKRMKTCSYSASNSLDEKIVQNGRKIRRFNTFRI